MSGQLQNGEQQFIDANGKPLDGGTVDFYIPNTTTRKNTWQDQALTILNTNPIVLDAGGRAVIWGSGSYRQILKDKNGNLIWDKIVADPITSLSASTGASSVGADDGTGGSIFTTVAGFITTLSSNIGSSFVGFIQSGAGAIQRTVQAKLRDFCNRTDYSSDTAFNSAKSGKMSLDGGLRLRTPGGYIAGDEEITTPTTRDAFIAGRTVTGSTDCHGFADRTVLDAVTDAGTYGCFDTTVTLRGTNVQNHVYSYQDRVNYNGSNTLQSQASLYSAPTFSGSGTWQNRYGAFIDNMNMTGAGVLQSQIGIYIKALNAAITNVAINMEQTSGYTIFAAGGAPAYHKGSLQLGATTNSDGVLLTVQGISGAPRGFLHSTSTNVQMGQIGGDYPVQLITNGGVRLELASSFFQYAVRPGTDNMQPLGDVTKRWNTVYAGTGTINTSDAREKQQVRALLDAEKAVAVRCKSLLRVFKFNDSVQKKGANARLHFGVLAQEISYAFSAEGLDANNYALFCYDEWQAEDEIRDEKGNVIQQAKSGGNRYGIRYDELLAFIISAI